MAQKGTSGRTVTAISNYYTLKMDNCTRVHEYELIINERRSDGRFKMSAVIYLAARFCEVMLLSYFFFMLQGVKNNILVALREKIGGIFATDTGKVLVSQLEAYMFRYASTEMKKWCCQVSPVKITNPESGEEDG